MRSAACAGAVQVAGPDRRAQAELRGVGALDRLVQVGDPPDRQRRAEHLLGRHRRVVGRVDDDGRQCRRSRRRDRGPRAVRRPRSASPPAASVRCTWSATSSRWTAVCSGPICEPSASPRPTFSRLALAVICSITSSATDVEHVHALDRQARLAAVVEAAHRRRAGRGREVGVVADDHRVRAAELERDALGAARGQRHDLLAHRRGAGERDLPNQRVRDERRAGDRAAAGDDVEHAGGQPALGQQLGEPQRRQRRRAPPAWQPRCCRPRAPARACCTAASSGSSTGTIAPTTPSGRRRT